MFLNTSYRVSAVFQSITLSLSSLIDEKVASISRALKAAVNVTDDVAYQRYENMKQLLLMLRSRVSVHVIYVTSIKLIKNEVPTSMLCDLIQYNTNAASAKRTFANIRVRMAAIIYDIEQTINNNTITDINVATWRQQIAELNNLNQSECSKCLTDVTAYVQQ